MEYRILGPLEIVDGQRVVDLKPPKQRALLLRLLIRPNETVSAEQLIDALWGERPPQSSAKLLQVYVSQLRRVLGDGSIETQPPGYAVRLEPEDVDTARFERVLGEGRQALAAGNAQLAASQLRRGLALWRGPALYDVAYESFAAIEAGRLEELRLVCLEERLAADLQLGRDVLAELGALVQEYPLRERLAAHLMLALYRSGRQADALDAYREVAGALRDELGLEPSPDLRALERSILNQDPALDSTGGSTETRPLPAPASSLVGREEELQQLSALIARNDVRLVTISGAGGSGKTRVALELARRVSPEFANGAAFVELAPVRDPSLVLPAIGQALGVPEHPTDEPVVALGRSLREQELLLVVDNFEHVMDAARELALLIVEAPRLTVVATSRRVLHLSGEHVFPLQPLPEDDAVHLFAERATARDPAADLDDRGAIRAICRRLDGLPLAIELAAARSAILTPPVVLERLARGVAALGTGPRDAPARQQTLRNTLAWSTDLLRDEERAASRGFPSSRAAARSRQQRSSPRPP